MSALGVSAMINVPSVVEVAATRWVARITPKPEPERTGQGYVPVTLATTVAGVSDHGLSIGGCGDGPV
jgi:hypothetical protein